MAKKTAVYKDDATNAKMNIQNRHIGTTLVILF
jgi:hypothetical protein